MIALPVQQEEFGHLGCIQEIGPENAGPTIHSVKMASERGRGGQKNDVSVLAAARCCLSSGMFIDHRHLGDCERNGAPSEVANGWPTHGNGKSDSG